MNFKREVEWPVSNYWRVIYTAGFARKERGYSTVDTITVTAKNNGVEVGSIQHTPITNPADIDDLASVLKAAWEHYHHYEEHAQLRLDWEYEPLCVLRVK